MSHEQQAAITGYVDFGWTSSEPEHTDAYLLEPIALLLSPLPMDCPFRALDLVHSTVVVLSLRASL